jgi:hypothetical protein
MKLKTLVSRKEHELKKAQDRVDDEKFYDGALIFKK